MENQPQQNVSLVPYTTYRVGGRARYFWEVGNETALIRALEWAQEKQIPFFILGGGSNVLFSDEGFAGLIIYVRGGEWELQNEKISVFAGASLPALVQFFGEKNLRGLEGCVGIPGTVGGAIRGNAGTAEGSIGDIILNVKVWRDGVIKNLTRSKSKFTYRNSRFKKNAEVILGAELLAEPGEGNLLKKMRKLRDSRAEKQPQGFSCGSFFQNPPGDSAGRLIEACELKGAKEGGAQISEKHANWIMNTGSATPEDIIKLARLARRKVKDRFGFTLEPEVEIVGLEF